MRQALIYVCLLCAAPAAASIRVTETQLSRDAAADVDAAVSGPDIVYASFRGGNWDVIWIDPAGEEVALTTSLAAQDAPDVDAGRVVWVDQRFGGPDLFLRDLRTGAETALTFDSEPDLAPAISGDDVVYIAVRGGVRDVRWLDLSTGDDVALTTGADPESVPVVDAGLAAWQVVKNGSVDIVAAFLGTTPFVVANGPENEAAPSVSAGRIAYVKGGDVFLYDAFTGGTVQITSDVAVQRNVVLDGDNLFWSDDSTGSFDPYLHDLVDGVTFGLSTAAGDQLVTDASGSRVVYGDTRFGNADVWSASVAVNHAPSAAPTASPTSGSAPLVVHFAANGADQDGDALTYAWAFGDGAASTATSPTHTYASAGIYTAWLTVSDLLADVSRSLIIVVDGAFDLFVRRATVHFKKKNLAKIDLRLTITAGVPGPDDLVQVSFDGITLLSVPFSAFRSDSHGECGQEGHDDDDRGGGRCTVYVLSRRGLTAEYVPSNGRFTLVAHEANVATLDVSNGVDVEVFVGDGVAVESIAMQAASGKRLVYRR